MVSLMMRFFVMTHTGSSITFEADNVREFMANVRNLGTKAMFSWGTYETLFQMCVAEIRCESGRVVYKMERVHDRRIGDWEHGGG